MPTTRRRPVWCHTAAFFLTVWSLSVWCSSSSSGIGITGAEAITPRRLLQASISSRAFLNQKYTTVPREILVRGGSSVEEEEEEDEQYDEEEYDSEEEEDVVATEEEDDEEDNEEEEDARGVQIEMNVEKYDDPLFPSPMVNLFCSLGVIFLGRKVDLLSPTMVRLARFVFVAYLILHQILIFYVTIQAKTINDRTPIELKNPLAGVLQSQLGGGDDSDGMTGNQMMKNLASSLLSSKSTVVEYDVRQAQTMQRGLILNLALMWFLHFKMNQVQPILINAISGVVNMFYSPLFQVYVLGRNLERPFKSLAAARAEQVNEEIDEEGEEEQDQEDTADDEYAETETNEEDGATEEDEENDAISETEADEETEVNVEEELASHVEMDGAVGNDEETVEDSDVRTNVEVDADDISDEVAENNEQPSVRETQAQDDEDDAVEDASTQGENENVTNAAENDDEQHEMDSQEEQ